MKQVVCVLIFLIFVGCDSKDQQNIESAIGIAQQALRVGEETYTTDRFTLNMLLGEFRENLAVRMSDSQKRCNIFAESADGKPMCGEDGDQRRAEFLALKPLLHNMSFVRYALTQVRSRLTKKIKADLHKLFTMSAHDRWQNDVRTCNRLDNQQREFLQGFTNYNKAIHSSDPQDVALVKQYKSLFHKSFVYCQEVVDRYGVEMRVLKFALRRENEHSGWLRNVTSIASELGLME